MFGGGVASRLDAAGCQICSLLTAFIIRVIGFKKMKGMPKLVSLIALWSLLGNGLVAQTLVVFTNNFEGTMPSEIKPGAAFPTGVQGFAGLGPTGNQFGGKFLRSPTGNLVALTLSNLPPHKAINIYMLFAAIDSLDGTGTYPQGDFFTVTVGSNLTNGTVVFRESFANALPTQIQSYVPPPGGQLARRVDLGFSGPGSYYTDSAYNFGVDSRFQNLSHTDSVAVLTFQIEGPGIQPLDDESWAMENLGITLSGVENAAPVDTPLLSGWQIFLTGSLVVWMGRRSLVRGSGSLTHLERSCRFTETVCALLRLFLRQIYPSNPAGQIARQPTHQRHDGQSGQNQQAHATPPTEGHPEGNS